MKKKRCSKGGADVAVEGVDELGVHGEVQSCWGDVVAQDVDPADVAHADPSRIRLELGRALVVLGGGRHDGDAGSGAGLAVGDRVGHRDGGVEACRGAHAQQVAIQKNDLQVVGDAFLAFCFCEETECLLFFAEADDLPFCGAGLLAFCSVARTTSVVPGLIFMFFR